MLLIILVTILISMPLLGLFLIYIHKWNRISGPVKTPDMSGKTVLITGASAGIGKEAARDMASRGARILMLCRNVQKAQNVADEIVLSTGNKNIQIYQVEMSDMESVKKCAENVAASEPNLHVMINNAGIGGINKRILTKEGLEQTMATNYYGHFLLTNLLLDLLKRSSPSRIINLSSSFHIFSPKFKAQNLNDELRFFPQLRYYGQSKMCMILFSVELARRLNGTGITANAVDPGFVRTEIFEKDPTISQYLFGKMISAISLTPAEGTRTVIYLAASPEVDGVSGRYFLESKIFAEMPMARDFRLAQQLWEASERDVKLSNHQKLFCTQSSSAEMLINPRVNIERNL